MKNKISITIDSKTLTKVDSIVDNVYIRNRSQAIEHLIDNALGENRTAVILSGGDIEKLRISDNDYRPTANVKNSTIIGLAIKKLRENGFKNILIVAQKVILNKIFELFGDGSSEGVKISYIEEKHSRGTAYSLGLLRGKIKTNFLVAYGDIIFTKINIDELWKDHLKHNAVSTLVLTTSSKPSEKGTLTMEGSKILKFTQKPKKSDIYLVFSPIFVAEPDIFNYFGDSLEENIFPELAEKGLLNGHMSSEKEIHIHKKEDLKKI
ncbi:MAG: sugar phosphate nucleotidyltransferase [Candidatus Woesearchaeota archaeon]|jgi:mannose-1-phosphate guanylyltransferase|nr:sugar phosphate nucleotidyltransferase [Candidatus Woesearchaeota archaeon]